MDDIPTAIRDAYINSGYSFNGKGGAFRKGVAKSLDEKAAIARKYIEKKEKEPRTSIRDLAKATKVSPGFGRKIVNELNNGCLINPKDKPQRRAKGAGSKSISEEDGRVLLELRSEDSSHKLDDYKEILQQRTGKISSRTTIWKWFKEYDSSTKKKGGSRVSNKASVVEENTDFGVVDG